MTAIAPETAAAITAAVAAQLDYGRARLREYALAESPSGDAEALARCADLVAAGQAASGGRVSRVPSPHGDHLVTSWGPDGGGHLLVVGHYDTVWPVGRLAEMPYTDDGTTVTGPGVLDMKSGLVALEMALRALADAGIAVPAPVRAVVVADEEVGSPTGRAVVEAALPGAAAVIGLESPHPDGACKSARRGSTRIALRVRGKEAHAALDPDRGVSAIDELLDQLAAVRAAVPGDGTTLCNIGRVEGGTRANVIAADAWAEIGLRFTDADAERRMLDVLENARPIRAGATVEAEVLTSRPTWQDDPANPLLAHLAAVGAALGQTIEGRPAAGAGDTNLPGSRGLPTLDGLGPRGRGAHAPDEHIVLAALPERAALLAALIAAPYRA
ncbi:MULTISPECIES: M20/M25/M40 family metallo-hydrolase [Thermomonosporaceae]|uniref:M20/M25/M40 family metallo-hydrolase n=1 Tax=Thermomonosporaceae TaxID=2012 RepID=UPI00255AA987|nr:MULTISPECIES: M20/M25/M40 family metallo-hydrolase [Thermomonosporaceae]MDL4775781.1 M20/M25/M40 family metallo-hydrolase [Actinomadura xylanilytica]